MTTWASRSNPEVWRWYHDHVGKGDAVDRRHVVADRDGASWAAPLPALEPMKPGSCGPAVARDLPGRSTTRRATRSGREAAARQHLHAATRGRAMLPDHLGRSRPFRGDLLREVLPEERALDWRDWPSSPMTERSRPPTATSGILGRVDDVINVAGHRLGTKELESALIDRRGGRRGRRGPGRDELRGRAVEMYVALKPGPPTRTS